MRTSELWSEMTALDRRVDDVFRGLIDPRVRRRSFDLPRALHKQFLPACDVFRADGELIVRMELPGIDPAKDVKVIVENGDLVIKGERRKTERVADEDYVHTETSFGSFERHLTLPDGAEEAHVRAEYHDGLLDVHVPAKAKAAAPTRPKTIPVTTTVNSEA